ncbi:hypothetical protein [Roseospira navarrensis]|uniref:DnaA N-terminal domain-containing protein n=1 Tax=Roseospira navarrensis TaxID=140058 RepID=A0A7X1ZEJ4_9PROT|nr:hypothetical protein [Roseospira navarrensis]MQX36843.1 hypothetical protein [Roseospira navarrensis]
MKPPARLTRRQEAAWEAFWSAYPRREGKAAAREVFAALTADAGPAGGVDPDFLARAARRYADQCGERRLDVMYIAHAKTWLRQRRFEDEVFADPAEPKAPPLAEPDDVWWPMFVAAGMDRSTYDRWIRPCRIEIGPDGGAVEIRAPSPFHAEWLSTRLDHVIRRALGRMPDIEVMP